MDGEAVDGGNSLFDPVRDALDNIKSGAKAGLKAVGKGDSKKSNKNAGARDGLKSAEKSAENGGATKVGEGLLGVRKNESGAGGFYSGAGKPLGGGKGKGNGKGKGFLKKGGPITGIILTLTMFGAFGFGSLSMQLVSWKENIYSAFGQNSAVMSKRSNFVLRKILKTNYDTTKTTFFGKNKFAIGSKLQKKLSEQGIEYVETKDANGKKVKMLVFEDADGTIRPVVASDGDLARVKSLAGQEIEMNGKKMKLNGEGMTLDAAKKNNVFLEKFDKGTRTLTGKIAGWFDTMADALLDRIVGKKARNQTDLGDDPTKEEVDKLMLGNESEGSDDSTMKVEENKKNDDGSDATDKNGKPIKQEIDADTDMGDGETYGKVKNSSDAVSPKSGTVKAVEALTNKAKKAAMGANIACMFLRSMGAINITIGAIQTINVIKYASKYLEIADKIKAGDTDKTTNLAMNNLNTPVKTTALDASGGEVELEGSVTSSDGWNQPFSNKNLIDENDPSAYMVNRENTAKVAMGQLTSGNGAFSEITSAITSLTGGIMSIGSGIAAFRWCNTAQLIGGVIDAVADGILLFTTAGIGNALKQFFKGAAEGALLSAVMAAVNVVIGAITPIISSWLVGFLSDVFLGKTGGFSLLSGTQNIMNSNTQMSTGRYADNDNAREVYALTKEVEKGWAEYDRITKSPFDITSKYTFLGSIVNAMVPIANQSSGMLSRVVAPVASLTRESILAVVSSTASAASDLNDFSNSLASDNNCAYLGSVGVAGDFACNKYVGAYVDALDTIDPDDVYKRMESYGSFDGEDSDGNPKVKYSSDYAKYIVACVSSDAQPGTMSASVEGFIQNAQDAITGGTAVGNGLLSVASGFVPGNGILDAIDSVEQQANEKWNSGFACTGKTGDSSFDEKMKDFSMYNLDQRVLTEMGIIENNSTVGFLNDYYEKNPLDNSFEGQIARVSGMTKEEVSDTLALIEAYNYIANYNPSERYAFGKPIVEMQEKLNFDNENQVAESPLIILINQTIYADVRNRNFAA